MLYIPIKSDAAPYLSAAIYQLSRPLAIRDQADVSTYFCGWCPHPTRTDVVTLEFPESYDLPIHLQADAEALANMLQYFVATGDLLQEEVDGIAAAVVAYAGSTIDVATLIPPSWQPYVMTREQAIASGWLAEPTMP